MLYATDSSTTVKKRLTAGGRAEAPRLCPWGSAVRGFAGAGLHGERDEGFGLYMLGAGYRGYIPSLRRFNSPDSWSPFGRGGINAYAFCGGDPVNGKDPSGHVGAKLSDFLYKVKLSYKYGLLATPPSFDFEELSRYDPVVRKIVGYLDQNSQVAFGNVSKGTRMFVKDALDPKIAEVKEFAENAEIVLEKHGMMPLYHAKTDGTWGYNQRYSASDMSRPASAFRYIMDHDISVKWTPDGQPAQLTANGIYLGQVPPFPGTRYKAFAEARKAFGPRPFRYRELPPPIFWAKYYWRHHPS